MPASTGLFPALFPPEENIDGPLAHYLYGVRRSGADVLEHLLLYSVRPFCARAEKLEAELRALQAGAADFIAKPFDVLKMDMKFIRNIAGSETDRRLVALILDIARYLGVKVVAEGVETAEQLGILRRGGCDLVQGYYFARPLPPEEFEALIEKHLEGERTGEG